MQDHPSTGARRGVPVLTALLLAAALGIGHPPFAWAQWNEPGSLRLNTPTLASQYAEVSPETNLEGMSQYTLEAWVYPTSYSGVPTILGNNYKLSWWLGLNPSGRVRFYPTGGSFVEGNAVVPLTAWTHVAATYQQGVGWSIYVNGVLDASGTGIVGAVGTSPADPVYIGADRETGPSYFWRGYLDEVRIWSQRRSATQILSTMYIDVPRPQFFAPGYAAIQAVWDFQLPNPAFAACGCMAAFDRASGLGKTANYALMRNAATVAYDMTPPLSPNTGIELNGVDDYAVLPIADGFSNGLTIEAWVAPRSWAGYPTIAGRGFQSSFWLGINGTGHLRFYPTGGIGKYVESAGTVPIGQWSHVAATYRNGITTLYLNGKLDSQTGAITGPVGENGADVHIGADNPSAYFFNGYLDEVRITRGAKPPLEIRKGMFTGYTAAVAFDVPVEGGAAEMRMANFDGYDFWTLVYGSAARFVKSGAAMGGSPLWAGPLAWSFHYDAVGGNPAGLPDGSATTGTSTYLYVPEDIIASSAQVFVAAPATDLSKTFITLTSPAGTTIDLLSEGAGRGRDLHTVFRDWAPTTLATGASPYAGGVQPSQPLSTFSTEMTSGYWQLVVWTNWPDERVDLWAWGITFQEIPVDVTGARGPGGPRLSMAGAHPVRGQGSLRLDVPAPARVDVRLIDIQGRLVRTLCEGDSPGGTTLLGFSAAGLEPGVYTALLRVAGRPAGSLKLTIVR